MLEFLNWFFAFFINFVDCLSRFPVQGELSLSQLIVSGMIFLVVGRYLIGQHYSNVVAPPKLNKEDKDG